jgi:DNA transformation protein and related proteins
LARASVSSDHICELFAGFGPVAVKRMFGGAGVYAGETIFAIVLDGVIYLKADEHTVPAFEAEGLTPFSYETTKKRVVMPYWRIPDRLYDDPEELAQWAREAVSATRRAAASKAQDRPSK